MNFNFDNAFNGGRLTKMTRASVHANGRLNFPADAVRQLSLSLDKALLVTPMDEKDFAVVVIDKNEDERGFEIKKSGPYLYVPFKSLLKELRIDFVKNTVVFDIIELNEQYNGHSVFKFNRRIITHDEDAKENAGEEQTENRTEAEGVEP